MSWIVDRTESYIYRIVWEDEDGVGMTLGESASLREREREPELVEMYRVLRDLKTDKDQWGFYWESKKAAQTALRLVKEIDKAVKANRPTICPCCKREMPK